MNGVMKKNSNKIEREKLSTRYEEKIQEHHILMLVSSIKIYAK